MKQSDKNIIWIFLHVPKTGGTTFSDQIKKHLKADEVLDTSQVRYGITESVDKNRLKNIRVILGHATYYGIHKFFPEKTPRYIIFLRDPAERIVSSYNFEMRSKSGKNMNFWRWYKLQQKNEVTSFMDMKFRGLAGTKANMPNSLSTLYSELFKIKSVTYFFQKIFKIYSDLFKTSREEYERQLRNSKGLLNRCRIIGIIPGLDKDLKILFKEIGVPTKWQNTNVTPTSQKSFELTPEIRSKIYRDNRYDKYLFDYALSLKKNKAQPS